MSTASPGASSPPAVVRVQRMRVLSIVLGYETGLVRPNAGQQAQIHLAEE